MARILLIDDDPDFSDALRACLTEHAHEVRDTPSAEEGLDLLGASKPFDLVLLDNRMPRMSGLEFLAALAETGLEVPVILMTSAHSDQTVIQGVQLGAFAYAIKPIDFDQILPEMGPVIQKALEITRRPRPIAIPQPDDHDRDESLIVGRSKTMLDVLVRLARLAKVDETVLILGETGTGKDLVARAIHTNSPRKNKPFVAMNSAGLSEQLLDSELFGHEKAAFTGAESMRKGRFEHAHGGTLFLDEVGEMPLLLQAKLLRVLENREIVRVGANDPMRVDVRVLAATHCDLNAMVQEKKFRQDLFYRLEGLTIHLPALRDRKDDIALLARHFIGQLFGAGPAPTLHPLTLERLRGFSWPGNVRQLQKVLCRAVASCDGSQILPEDIDFGDLDVQAPASLAASTAEAAQAGLRAAIAWAWKTHKEDVWPRLQEQLERELLQYALAQPGLSQVQLKDRLGIARNTLRARIKQYGLEAPDGGDA